MLGVAGILGQEVLHPEQWWYTAGMPENLPSFDGNKVNMGKSFTLQGRVSKACALGSARLQAHCSLEPGVGAKRAAH